MLSEDSACRGRAASGSSADSGLGAPAPQLWNSDSGHSAEHWEAVPGRQESGGRCPEVFWS